MLCLRPEQLSLAPAGLLGPAARILSREYHGGSVSYVVQLEQAGGAPDLLVREQVGSRLWQEGERVCVNVQGHAHVLE